MIFRTADLSDLQNIKELAFRTWSEYKKELTPENWSQLQVNLMADSTYIDLLTNAQNIVCEEKGKIVGMAFLVLKGNPTEIFQSDWSYIRFVTVHPDYQGKGIGRQLTEKCIELAKNNGEKHVALHTSDMMIPAQNLYKSMGFVLQKKLPERFGRKYFLFLKTLV